MNPTEASLGWVLFFELAWSNSAEQRFLRVVFEVGCNTVRVALEFGSDPL
jgi:hypothetical protein